MNKRIFISILFGTIILFLWNAISWMALPFHSNTLTNIPNNAIQTDVLKKEMPESGVYHYPGLPADNSAAEIEKITSKLKEGPRITLMVYKNSPTKLFEPSTFILSLLLNLITVIFTFIVVSRIQAKNRQTIFISTLLIGLLTVIVSDLSQMNWFMFPLNYTLVNALDKIIAFGLLGLLFSFYTFNNQKNV